MKKSDLSKLVREAAISNHVENIDPESGNYQTPIDRATIYLPYGAQLGDKNLSLLIFHMDASAFKDMTNEEITEFVVEQFPEHKWGMAVCINDNGSLSVTMHEAKAHITTLIRACAAIVFYGKPKKKQFTLSVELEENKILPFMDESDFVQLVTNQFPQHNWYDTHWCQKDGVITVTLFSAGTKGKSPQGLNAKSVTLIKDTCMIAMPLELDGSKNPMLMTIPSYHTYFVAPAVTVFIHMQIAELFGEDNVLKFISEQFPNYRIHPRTKFTDDVAFQVTLFEKEQDD